MESAFGFANFHFVHILELFWSSLHTQLVYVANSTWPVELPLLVLEEDKKLPVYNHVMNDTIRVTNQFDQLSVIM